MEKEEQLLRKRFVELSNTAYRKGIPVYSDFLNLNELNILHSTPKDMFPVSYRTFGGYACSERQMAAFIPDAFSLYAEIDSLDKEYPITILRIVPLNKKFSDELTHRDYLGAILNLGIERGCIGDILVQEKAALVFVKSQMKDYIVEELSRIRHTTVMTEVLDAADFEYRPRYEEIQGTVASVRLDSLLALAWNSSRSKLTSFIEGGKVFVNGKLIVSNGYQVKENDIISVRGLGRFQYLGAGKLTKKGRITVLVHKYI